MCDLNQFSLREMTELGIQLRKLGDGASSMEEAATRVVRYLYESLRGAPGEGDETERACELVRFFKTHKFADLDADLRRAAEALAPVSVRTASLRCLTLLATAGALPEWNSRHASRSHKAIPLVSVELLAQAPMVSQLILQFGLSLSDVIRPGRELLVDREQTTYNVFHIPEAVGSPYVPAQDSFVIPRGIRSVVGMGGMLPSGDLFALILFSRVPISRDTAERFRTLSLSIKLAILPFVDHAVFSRQEGRLAS